MCARLSLRIGPVAKMSRVFSLLSRTPSTGATGAFIEECTVNLMGPNIPSLSLPLRQHLMLTQSGGTFIEVVTERCVEHH